MTTSSINELDLNLQDPHTDNINRLIMYIKIINKSRWDDNEDWFNLGAIIHNEHAPFSLFDEMSQLSTKYDKEMCLQKWNQYQDPFSITRNLTIETLIAMAKADNPSEFLNCSDHDIQVIQLEIMQHGITDDKAARLYYHLYPNHHIYDRSTGVWYYIDEYNMWDVDTKLIHIANDIKCKVRNQLEMFCSQADVTDKLRDRYNKMLINATRVLETHANNLSVVHTATSYYGVATTDRLFESSNHLFAFKNGVYDLNTKTFRSARLEEYVLVNCNYDYKPMTPEMSQVKDRILEIARSVVKLEDGVTYLLQSIAQSLSGNCNPEHLYVWQGGNGKGLLRELIMYTFGFYYDTMNVSCLLVNNTRSANASSSMMAKKRYCRIIFSTEPPMNIKMNATKLKSFADKTQVMCRNKHGTMFSFVPKFRLFIPTNFELKLNTTGNGIKKRMQVQEFPWKFTDNPTKPHEKLIDTTLKAEIRDNPLFRITFFHLLLEYYYMEPN